MNLNVKKYFSNLDQVVFVILLSLFIVFIFSQKTIISSSDLGRHLENGRIIGQETKILHENFYSYTATQHTFINHHWLYGVIVYQIYALGGFTLLTLFNIILALAIFWLFFYLAYKKANFFIAALISLPVVLLLGERTEIRPEIFSSLYLILLWLVLESKKLTKRQQIVSIFIIFLAWVNTHIYFFLGLALLGIYLLTQILTEIIASKKINLKIIISKNLNYIYFFLTALLSSLLNPNFLKGLLYPFNILRKYGYPISENKSIFYLQNLFFKYNFLLTKKLIIVLILSFVVVWFFKKRANYLNHLLALFFIFLAIWAQRNLALFGLATLVLLSENIFPAYQFWQEQNFSQKIYTNIKQQIATYQIWFLSVLLVLLSIFTYLDYRQQHFYFNNKLGWGLSRDNYLFLDFLDSNPILTGLGGSWGPIFNNYDIGSALIFALPEKVFIDNRPEAYSVDFLKNTLILAQQDEEVWQKILEQYQFKSIIFSHNDGTDWGRSFLKERLQDRAWALIYLDEHVLVLVRRELFIDFDLSVYELDHWQAREKIRELSRDKNNILSNKRLSNLALLFQFTDICFELLSHNLRLVPNNTDTLFYLASNYIEADNQKNNKRALQYLKQIKKRQKLYPGLYEQMGLAYWYSHDYDLAEKVWRQGVKKNKNLRNYLEQINELKAQSILPGANSLP